MKVLESKTRKGRSKQLEFDQESRENRNTIQRSSSTDFLGNWKLGVRKSLTYLELLTLKKNRLDNFSFASTVMLG